MRRYFLRRMADASLELDPGHVQATELRGAMRECAAVYTEESTKLVLLGSPSEAVSNLTHAMALQPADASLRMRRGAARRAMGELLPAVSDLEAAVQMAPRHGTDDESLEERLNARFHRSVYGARPRVLDAQHPRQLGAPAACRSPAEARGGAIRSLGGEHIGGVLCLKRA